MYFFYLRAYVFLVTCGNGFVLLQNAKLQNSIDNIQNTKEVVETLQLFVEQMGGFSTIDTIENKQSMKTKLNY